MRRCFRRAAAREHHAAVTAGQFEEAHAAVRVLLQRAEEGASDEAIAAAVGAVEELGERLGLQSYRPEWNEGRPKTYFFVA